MLREWMTMEDLSEYLQIPLSKIRTLVTKNRIPFHNSHNFLRFNRHEIDEWMKASAPDEEMKTSVVRDAEKEDVKYVYRAKSIKDYTLTATKILIGNTPWLRLPDFINRTVAAVKEHNRDYLYRKDFKPFHANFNDYLRVSCQLGLIDSVGGEEEDNRRKRYYPTAYAKKISSEVDIGNIKRSILDSILHIVKKNMETNPDERHSILLLWYLLKIKSEGLVPQARYFMLSKDKSDSYFPLIRLNFASSLCSFLFDDDREKEREFLKQWESLL